MTGQWKGSHLITTTNLYPSDFCGLSQTHPSHLCHPPLVLSAWLRKVGVTSTVVDPADKSTVVGTGELVCAQQFDEVSIRDVWAFQSWLAAETLVITA